MTTAQLFGLVQLVAKNHKWVYLREDVPGALPPKGLGWKCCGFIWPNLVHGVQSYDLKYCHACYKLHGVTRWLCRFCRDDRERSDPYEAECMAGYCPAKAREHNANWHAAGSPPWWFRQWKAHHPDFAQWDSESRQALLDNWYPGFLEGRLTRELSLAQWFANSSVDPSRSRRPTLPDDSSFYTRVRTLLGVEGARGA